MNTLFEFCLLILATYSFLIANGLFGVPIPAHSWAAAALAVVSACALIFVIVIAPALEEAAA